MKKMIKTCSALMAVLMMMLLAPATVKAENCSSSVDVMCTAFNKMKGEINELKSMGELETLNFDETLSSMDFDSIPDSCADYVLTSVDKNKIIKSFDGFIDALAAKTSALTDGIISKAMMEEALKPQSDTFHSLVKQSKTFGDVIVKMNEVF